MYDWHLSDLKRNLAWIFFLNNWQPGWQDKKCGFTAYRLTILKLKTYSFSASVAAFNRFTIGWQPVTWGDWQLENGWKLVTKVNYEFLVIRQSTSSTCYVSFVVPKCQLLIFAVGLAKYMNFGQLNSLSTTTLMNHYHFLRQQLIVE